MGLNPRAERLATECAGGKVQKAPLRLLDCRVKLLPVQHEERFERRVADALVAINERMIQDQSVGKRGALGRKADVQIGSVKGGTRLRDGRLEGAQVANGRRAPGTGHNPLMEPNDLGEAQVAFARHLSEPAIQLGVLREDKLGDGVERGVGLAEKIAQSGRREHVGRDPQPRRDRGEFLLLDLGEIDVQAHRRNVPREARPEQPNAQAQLRATG